MAGKDGGGAWNRVTAFASLVIAVATLGVVFYQANLMRQQTRAATWPYISVQASSSADEFKFIVTNSGVGPARLEAVTVSIDGQPVETWSEALERLSGGPVSGGFFYSAVYGYVFAPQETRAALVITDPALLRTVAPQLQRLSGSICYCSVLDECTMSRTIDAGGLGRDRDRVVRDRCAEAKALKQFRN